MIPAILFVLLGLHPLTTPSVVEDSLFSPILHRTMHYRLLVAGETHEGPPLPVLVLLHGFGGDQRAWTDLTTIEEAVADTRIAIIMPAGENSWYVNAVNDSAGRYEDALLQDLLPAIRRRVPIDTTRMGVAGLSMGGYGALALGLRHPDHFRFIGALSASLDVPFGIPDLERNGRGGLKGSLQIIFGPDTSYWARYAPERLAQRIEPSASPYLYLANGIQDEFALRLTLYRSFADLLRSRGLHYEYHETPGRHAWEYWNREIHGVLRRFLEVTR
jgi:putative tributyrin esterase